MLKTKSFKFSKTIEFLNAEGEEDPTNHCSAKKLQKRRYRVKKAFYTNCLGQRFCTGLKLFKETFDS